MLNKKIIKNIFRILQILLIFNRWFIIGLIILSFITSLLPIVSTLLTQELINILQINSQNVKMMIIVLSLYLSIKILLLICNALTKYLSSRYSDYLMMQLNILFQDKCAKLDFCDFENSVIYDMLQRAEQQIGVRPFALLNDLLAIFSSVLSFFGSLVILTQWQIWAVIGFVILPIFSYKYYAAINKLEYNTVYKRAKEERKSWYYAHLLIKDYFIKEVRLLGITKYLINKFANIKLNIYKENVMLSNNRLKFNLMYQIANFIFSSFIIVYAVFETLVGRILVGNFLTYINITNRLETSITSITSACFSLYTNSMYCEYILTFFDFVDSKNNTKENKSIKIKEIDKIELKNISFKYPNTNVYALKDINITFEPNKIYTLVGENGSGKTTLIKILSGLYTNYEGDIFVNGINLKNIDLTYFQKVLSVTFQDYNNYEFAISENIKLGDITNNEIKDIIFASRLSGADKFINKLPHKYNQQVGTWFENGIQLSGGQWQKLAISRGLFRKASVYIFDEPTSSLDPSSEYLFFSNLLTQIADKITIFVTHRFVNAKLADQIIVLKNGKNVENGTHEQLMKLNGEYCRLYKIQLGQLEYTASIINNR